MTQLADSLPARPEIRASSGRRLWWLAALFVVTGVSALLAEQVFEKLLSTVVGASAPAATLVLAVYFLGLTGGGIAYSRLASRVTHPLRLYGLLEGGIGLWALALALLFSPLQAVSSRLVHLGGDAAGAVFGLRLAVAAAWILPPTLAMGASFPAVVGALEQLGAPGAQRLIARFYAWNLLGAVVGAALGPYLFFPRAGLTGTLYVIVLLQAGVAAMVLRRAPGVPRRTGPGPARHDAARGGVERGAAAGRLFLLGLAFASAFLFFGFEVLWTHLIGAVLGNSVYAFANMLTMVLAGLFLGGLVSSLIFRGPTVPAATLPAVLIGAAAVLAVSLSAWDDVPALLVRLGAGVETFAGGEAVRLAVAAALVGLPALALGLVYPLLFRDPRFPMASADSMAARLGASNAVGCICGALATGFLLLPAMGSEGVFRIYIFVLALVAVALSLADLRRRRAGGRRAAVLATVWIVLAVGVAQLAATVPGWRPLRLTAGTHVYFRPGHVRDATELLYWHEDLYGGFTTVVGSPASPGTHRSRVLLTNGKFQGSDGGEIGAQVAFAAIPIFHQPRRGRALAIGLGTGHTAAVVAAAGYRRVEIAEISPGIVGAARRLFSHVNDGLLERDRVTLHLEDGRNVLLRDDGQYDLITMELTSIWFAGASNLYSRQFYELARARLAPGGVLQQWIQFHHIAPEEVLSAVATLASVFERVSLWHFGGQGILLASDGPQVIEPGLVDEIAGLPDMRRHVDILHAAVGPDLMALARRRLLDETETRRLLEFTRQRAIPLNTDGNRYLEFSTPRHNLERRNHAREVIETLLTFVEPGERQRRLGVFN
jgi:spermidine synthase